MSPAFNKQWQEVLGDTGYGKMTFQNDDPDLDLVEYGDFMQFQIDDVPRFLALVEKMDRTDIDPAEDVAEQTVVSGRGALAVLEDAIVYPDLYIETVPFADARIFNFSSFASLNGANDWAANSTGVHDWGVYTAAGIYYTNVPAGFPDTTAHWLGPEAPDGSGNNPVGDWYLKSVLPSVDEGQYRLSVCADDSVEVYVDNVPVHKAEGVFGRLITIDLWLDSALHDISFHITNLPLPLGGGPSGLIWSLQELNADGTVGAVVWHSVASGSALDFFTSYPTDPPGFTAGDVLDTLFDEAQDRGALLNLSWDFSATVDSDGVAWADVIQPSFQIGADYLTVIKQLGESYLIPRIDPDVSGGLVLHVYQSLGGASGVVYDRAENITDLKHQGTI